MTTEKLKKKMTRLGRRGGAATKRKKGKAFFAKISRMRKSFKGGRKPLPKPEVVATPSE